MSSGNDLMLKKAIQQASREIGVYVLAGALLVSILMPLVGLTTVWVYGKYQVQSIQRAMQERGK